MSAKINKAMILAAGRGTRMRELTDALPKPLIAVNGRTLIDRIADKIAAHGIRDCVVNVCYLGGKIKANFAKRSDLNFVYSDEESALETGGGVKKALPLLKDDAFFVLNADPAWTENGTPALQALEQAWKPDTTADDACFRSRRHGRLFAGRTGQTAPQSRGHDRSVRFRGRADFEKKPVRQHPRRQIFAERFV